jgi:hypothetical protein
LTDDPQSATLRDPAETPESVHVDPGDHPVSRFDQRIRRDLGARGGRYPRSADVEAQVDHAVARWQHRARVASVATKAVTTIALLLVLGAVVVWAGGDPGVVTRAAKRVPASTNTSARTPAGNRATALPPGAATPRSDDAPARRPDRASRTEPAGDSSGAEPDRAPAPDGASPSTAPPDDASPPAITAISISPPDPVGVCTASWSADDGGTPIEEYVVSTESVIAASASEPVDAAGIDTPPADTDAPTEVVESTTDDAFTDTPLGASLTVTARNAVGTSKPTEAVVCGD